ncbi:MAG: hypothetical protein LIP05_10975 [Tannerellaceae bacterium]|nr:hypothetical protein [Tannerellaceae bacterium]
MGEKYEYEEMKPEERMVREPALEYGCQKESETLPIITEEELKNTLSGNELRERMHKFIDELFDRNES